MEMRLAFCLLPIHAPDMAGAIIRGFLISPLHRHFATSTLITWGHWASTARFLTFMAFRCDYYWDCPCSCAMRTAIRRRHGVISRVMPELPSSMAVAARDKISRTAYYGDYLLAMRLLAASGAAFLGTLCPSQWRYGRYSSMDYYRLTGIYRDASSCYISLRNVSAE